jgi:hypothetical protein
MANKKGALRFPACCLLTAACVCLLSDNVIAAREGGFEKTAKAYEDIDTTVKDSSAPISRPVIEYTSGNLRDPFQGVNTKPSSANQSQVQVKELPKMIVQGIMWGGAFNQAIVNNKVIKAGDTIEGAQVVSIDRNKIIMIFEGRKYTLTVVGASAPQEQPKPAVP